MGNPKQKWTTEEEEALRVGIAKHGTGKWKNIQKDSEFNHLLYSRSNIDLKMTLEKLQIEHNHPWTLEPLPPCYAGYRAAYHPTLYSIPVDNPTTSIILPYTIPAGWPWGEPAPQFGSMHVADIAHQTQFDSQFGGGSQFDDDGGSGSGFGGGGDYDGDYE